MFSQVMAMDIPKNTMQQSVDIMSMLNWMQCPDVVWLLTLRDYGPEEIWHEVPLQNHLHLQCSKYINGFLYSKLSGFVS